MIKQNGGTTAATQWVTSRLALISAMAFMINAAGCSDDPTTPRPEVPTVDFTSPENGATLTPADDANDVLEGIQPAFELDITRITEGTLEVTATTDLGSATADDRVTLNLNGSGLVVVSNLTILPGSNRILAEVRSNNGVLLATSQIDVELDAPAIVPNVEIVEPDDGDTIDLDDDTDPDVDGIQVDVDVALSNIPATGAAVTVAVNGDEAGNINVDADATVETFEGITLPEGDVTIEVTVESPDGSNTDTVNVTVEAGVEECEIELLPPLVDAICDFGLNPDEDPDTDGIQRTFTAQTNCASVTFSADGNEDIDVDVEDGEAQATLTLEDGAFEVTVTTENAEGLEASQSLSYTVDLVAPEARFFFPEDGANLTAANDLDGDLENGVNINVTVLLDETEDEFTDVALTIDGEAGPTAVAEEDDRRVVFEELGFDAGEHTLEITVQDGCGNRNTTSVTFNVELSNESLTIDNPESGAEFGPADDLDEETPGLQQTFTVTAEGVEPGQVAFIECRRVNSQAYFKRSDDVARPDEATFDIPVTLPDGAYSCRARVEALSLTSADILVSASLVREAVEITQPEDGQLFNTAAITVSARTINLADNQAVTLTVGDDTYEANIVDGGVVFSDVALVPGENTLQVAAQTDQAPSDSVTVELDVEPPAISFVSPSADEATLDADDDVVGDLDNGIQINVQLAVLGVDEGTEVCVAADGRQPACAATDADGNVTAGPLMVTPGVSTLVATTSDEAGNEGQASLEIDVQVERPSIDIIAPADGSASSQAVTDVNIQTDLPEGTDVELFVNDADDPAATGQTDADGQASFTDINLVADQDNILQAFGTDARGQGASPRITITVDTSIPAVSFTEPADEQVFNLDAIDGDGAPGFQINVAIAVPNVGDDQPAQLQVDCDGTVTTFDATVQDGAATFERVTLADQANCDLTASATNRAEVSGDDTISVRVDRQAPVLTLVRLNDGDVLNINDDEDEDTPGIQRTIRVRFEGLEAGQEITLEGGPINDSATVEENSNQVLFGPVTLPDGELALTVSATDTAGNQTQVGVELLIDSSSLALSFENIDNPAEFNADNDVDPDTEGLQAQLTVVGVRGLTGNQVRLCSNRAPVDAPACSTGGFGQIDEAELATELASAIFTVTLPDGEVSLMAETDLEDESVLNSETLLLTIDNVRPEIARFELTSDTLDPAGVLNIAEDVQPLVTTTLSATFEFEGTGVEEGDRVQLFEDGLLLIGATVDENLQATITQAFGAGPHTVEVDVLDNAGNSAAERASISFMVDLAAPTLAFDNLTNNQTLNGQDDADANTDDLQFTVVGRSDAIGRTARLVQVVGDLDAFDTPDDDVELGAAEVGDDGLVNFAVTLPQGAVALALRVDDEAANTSDAAIAVNIDTIAPVVTILSPGNNTNFTEEPEGFRTRPGFQIEVLLTSDAAGREITLEDTNTQLALAPAVTPEGGTATIVPTLQIGENSFQAVVTDEAGNEGRSEIITVTVEIEGCGIVFSAPQNNPLFVSEDNDGDPENGVALSFETVVADVQTCLGQDVTLFVDDQEVAATALGEGGTVAFNDVVFDNNGTYTVLAQIDDGQGNITSTNAVTVFVDLIAPTVAFVAPADNPAGFGIADDLSVGTEGLQTSLTVGVTNAVGGTLEVTSSAAIDPVASDIAVTGDEVQIDVTLPEGTQTITVTVTDRAESQAQAEASFVVDLTAPAAIELAGVVTNRRLGTTELVWVAPGDDNTTDFVTNYEVRRSTDPITAENFDAAELIETFAPNVAPQQEESYTVADLPWEPAQGAVSVTYHIAVRAADDQGNTSALGDNFSVTQGLDEATFKADGSGDSYGFQVHSIGDINNDGRDDFLASELFGERGHIIYGRDDVEALNEPNPTTQILTGDVEDGFGFFGGRATGLGDINGDGFNDFAVGSYFANGFSGKVYVYFGVDGGQVDGEPDVRFEGLVGAQFGVSMDAAQFVDDADEGINDIVIGASADSGNGAVYVIRGRTDWPATITMSDDGATNATNGVVRLAGAEDGSEFGYQIARLSDLNEDGFEELAVAARRTNANEGAVHIFSSGASVGDQLTAGVDDTELVPFENAGLFGSSMVSGDIDGDNILDLVIGGYDSPDAIGVYLFTDGEVPTEASLFWSLPTGLLYGEQLDLADINGDGALDLLVGGNTDTGDPGLLDIYFNQGGSFDELPSLRYNRSDNWGNDVAAGDFDGDGFDDLITDQHNGPGSTTILY